MGGRQSKRSVDITTTPKKEGTEDQQQPLDGRLGHIEEGEGESKPAANGAPTVSATDIQEEVVQNGSEQIADGEIETAAQASEAETTITGEKEKEEDSKKKEKKEKVKKKWSFRSISFSRKDKSKPSREDRNGGISKEEVAEVSEEKVETSEVAAPSEPALAPQQELGSEAAKASEVTEKMEDITAAKVKTETEEPAAVETLPVQAEESSKEQQTPTSQSEPVAVSAPVPPAEEVPPPLPASPPPTEVEATSTTEPQKVDETIAQVESAPAEPKDLIDVPGVTVQPASPIPTPKVEEGVVAKVEEPETPAPVEEPKTEDVGVSKPVETQVPSLVEEKTEAPVDAVEPVLPVPQVEEPVPAPIEIPAQVEPEPLPMSDIKTPETQDSVQASIETPQSQTVQAAVEE